MGGGVLLWCALPPLELWPLAWVAPVLWVLLIRRQELPGRHPYRAVWLAGVCFWLAAFHWLRFPHWATALCWVPFAMLLGLHWVLFIGLARAAVHRLRIPVVIAAPVVLVGVDFLFQAVAKGSILASLGHTQYRCTALIQLSDLVGVYGISLVVMFAAACLARALPWDGAQPALWPLGAAAAVLVAGVTYGQMRLAPAPVPGGAATRIALIQDCIDVASKADETQHEAIRRRHLALSRRALETYGALDLIVWPETMYCAGLDTRDPWPSPAQIGAPGAAALVASVDEESRRGLAAVAAELRTPVLLGAIRHHRTPGRERRYNSAVLLSSSGDLLACYDKNSLVVFGEFIPLADRFPWLNRLVSVSLGRTPGTAPLAFDAGGLSIAPNICYEIVSPEGVRRQLTTLARQGRDPAVLINLSNENWFRGSSELEMGLAAGVFRAVENRKPVLIAANAGVSAFIDANGRIRAQSLRCAPDILLAEVRPDARRSGYLRHGNWLAWSCLAGCLGIALAGGAQGPADGSADWWSAWRRRGPRGQRDVRSSTALT